MSLGNSYAAGPLCRARASWCWCRATVAAKVFSALIGQSWSHSCGPHCSHAHFDPPVSQASPLLPPFLSLYHVALQ